MSATLLPFTPSENVQMKHTYFPLDAKNSGHSFLDSSISFAALFSIQNTTDLRTHTEVTRQPTYKKGIYHMNIERPGLACQNHTHLWRNQ